MNQVIRNAGRPTNVTDHDAMTAGRALEEESGDTLRGRRKRTKILAVTSGKGGVGKTNIVANLAVSLSEMG